MRSKVALSQWYLDIKEVNFLKHPPGQSSSEHLPTAGNIRTIFLLNSPNKPWRYVLSLHCCR